MANESALFEDDFLLELEDDAPPKPDPVLHDDEELTDIALDDGLDDPAPEPVQTDAYIPEPQGGDRPIPAISIRVFYERAETAELIDTASQDRRMVRADVEAIAGGLPAAIAYLTENATPNLLIVESSAQASEMIAQIDELAGHCDPGVQVMVIGATNDIPLYRQLVARGVSEYLVPPVLPVQLIRATAELFSDPDTPFLGKQITIAGAKGGVGASTIAHNLAWSISENARLSTTLVDLDLSFGTTALDFNQEGTQTVVDALLAPERADEAVVARLLAQATERLSLFTAPATVTDEFEIDPEAYDTVIQVVRRTVPFVVVDLPHAWSNWVRDTLVASDEVIIVCQPDLASLRNGKNMIDRLKAERPNDQPPKLILNMSGIPKRPEIPVKDFAAAIGVEPEIVLPFDPALFGMASNNGQMISEAQPDAKSSLAIDHLASVLTGQTVAVPERTLFQKILRK